MRKVLFFVLIVAVVFVSCDEPSSGETVVFWIPFDNPNNAYLEQIVNEYNATNPAMRVELFEKDYDTYVDELLDAISSGTQPDVVMLDRFTINQWAAQNHLHDLTPYLSMINTNDYTVSAWSETQYNNQTFALPFDTDVRVLYYNKQILEEVYMERYIDPYNPSWRPDDLDFTNSPVTLAQLEIIARHIDREDTSGYTRAGFIPQMDQGHHYTWGLVFGGEFVSADGRTVTPANANVIDAFEFLYDWNSDMGIDKVQAFLGKYNYMTDPGDYSTHPFITRDLAMTINGDWFMDVLERYAPDLEYGVTFIPVLSAGDKPISWIGGYAWAIPANSQKAEEAFKFLAFGCGPAGQRIYCRQFYKAPTLMSLFMEEWYADNQAYKDRWGTDLQPFFRDIYRMETTRPILPVGASYWNALSDVQNTIVRATTPPNILSLLQNVEDHMQSELNLLRQ